MKALRHSLLLRVVGGALIVAVDAHAVTDDDWVSLASQPGTDASVSACVFMDTNRVVVGGGFRSAGQVSTRGVAIWDGERWDALGAGLPGGVSDLMVSAGTLYASGTFLDGQTHLLPGVAAWDGVRWQHLGPGLERAVEYLTPGTNGLPVAAAHNVVAAWDGVTWHTLGEPFEDGYIEALAGDPAGNLYIAVSIISNFTQIGGMAMRWNGIAWVPLPGGLNGNISDIIWDGSEGLTVGGWFDLPGTSNISVAQWDGAAWAPIGTGPSTAVSQLARDPMGSLYAMAGDSLWEWDGTNWYRRTDSFNRAPYDLAASAGRVIIGGEFGYGFISNSVAVPHIAEWSQGELAALGEGWTGVFYDLKVAEDGTVYGGAHLRSAPGLGGSGGVQRWDGNAWSFVGTGLGEVSGLALSANNDLYAGGRSMGVGGVYRWDDPTWQRMGAVLDGVSALACDTNGTLFVGGAFTVAGGAPVEMIARWENGGWASLGSGITETGTFVEGGVFALAFGPSNTVYAAGEFNTAGGVPVANIACWDGIQWRDVGGGFNGRVSELFADPAGNLYAGGHFTEAGGTPANRIARWDGVSWHALGTGMDDIVFALSVDAIGRLFAGGAFSTAGGVSAKRVACWVDDAWQPLGSGLDGSAPTYVFALATDGAGCLYAAGNFYRAGGKTSPLVAAALLGGDPERDADGDSLSDWWELQYFGGTTNAAAGADSDGDGHHNREEAIAGTDPRDAYSVLNITSLTHNADGGVLHWRAISGRLYSVECATTSVDGAWSVMGDPMASGCYTARQDQAAGPVYYRLQVHSAPLP